MPGALLWGWDNTNKKWIPLAVDANGYVKVDMSNINLDDLADVDVSGVADDDFFYYDSASGLWKSRKLVNADIPNLAASKITSGIFNPARVGPKIQDADADTYWWVEKTADEDKIHGKVKGVEAFLLDDAGILTLAKQSSACAYLGSDQTITTGTLTTVKVDTEIWDIQSEFNTDTHRFVATEAGLYLALFGFRFTNGSVGDIYVGYMRVNGTIKARCQVHGSSTGALAAAASTIVLLSATDYIDAAVYQNSGSDKTLTGASAADNRLAVFKLA